MELDLDSIHVEQILLTAAQKKNNAILLMSQEIRTLNNRVKSLEAELAEKGGKKHGKK